MRIHNLATPFPKYLSILKCALLILFTLLPGAYLQPIKNNFQNVLGKVENRCDEKNVQDILLLIDLSD